MGRGGGANGGGGGVGSGGLGGRGGGVFMQSCGPEARGGACAAELIIDDEPIDYPMVSNPELLVLMSQEAFSKYGSAAAEGAQLIVDTDLVESATREDWLPDIPATRLAEELGNRMVANGIMLGFLCG